MAAVAYRCSALRLSQHARCFATRPRCAGAAAARRWASHTARQATGAQLPRKLQGSRVPVYVFAHEAEAQAEEQLRQLANSNHVVGFVSAMPDVHLGKGATIGSVFASEDAVCPNAVGVDIGCGMVAVPMQSLRRGMLALDAKQKIQHAIKRVVPTGRNSHKHAPSGSKHTIATVSDNATPSKWLEAQVYGRKTADMIRCQLGTLGGGNHFVEVVYDEEDRVWLMLHSGSRRIGNHTAQTYDKIARKQTEQRGEGDQARRGLNWLLVESKEGQAYLRDMTWCQAYALENRMAMMRAVADVVERVTGDVPDMTKLINVHHNFCQCESCAFVDPVHGETVSKDLWVTRKGATSARAGELGIIPGSMATGSYIVRGKGDPLSWQSCSHGAGRRMSRTQAEVRGYDATRSALPLCWRVDACVALLCALSTSQKELSQSAFEASLGDVVCDRSPKLRDEAPAAYKDLSQVMENQRDLVEVVHKLLPLINVKGF